MSVIPVFLRETPDRLEWRIPMRIRRHALQTVVMAHLLCAPAVAAPGVALQTFVAPQADEDLAGPCQYEITLTDPSHAVKGVWVIFDRGRDMLRYYGDPDVQAFAERHDLALMLPFHCRAKSYEDMNMDPARGIGRALFTALAQFAESSGHHELATTRVILLGFSGTGSLVGRFPEYAPDRVLAAIPSAPGHFDPLGVDTITLTPRAASIPQLILAGSADAVSGTPRPYAYFRRHFDEGAPWTFVVQNNTPHCCIINAKALVPSTTEDCPSPRPALVPPSCHSTKDSWGETNWMVGAATMGRGASVPGGMMPAGWLPTRAFGERWMSFMQLPQHPITSLP